MHVLSPVYPWHIQNSGIFRILAYAKPETYSEPHWYIQNFAIHSGPRTYIQNPGLFRIRDILKTLSNIYSGTL